MKLSGYLLKEATKEDKSYRKSQFRNIPPGDSESKVKIKFIKSNGKTNWIDIENDEFEKIKKILTK